MSGKRKSKTKRRATPAKKKNAPAKHAAHPPAHHCARCARVRRESKFSRNAPKRPRARARARNPKRPPRGWWDDCMAGLEARDGASVRDARAVCGAAWWNLPASKRRAVVRRLERSRNPQDRRSAYAMARAERSHARRARRSNPGRAAASRRPNPPKELVSLVYKEQKEGDARPYEYEHDFSRGARPKLVESRGRLAIKGGGYTMRDGWIHG